MKSMSGAWAVWSLTVRAVLALVLFSHYHGSHVEHYTEMCAVMCLFGFAEETCSIMELFRTVWPHASSHCVCAQRWSITGRCADKAFLMLFLGLLRSAHTSV